jgi:hypothetical protein
MRCSIILTISVRSLLIQRGRMVQVYPERFHCLSEKLCILFDGHRFHPFGRGHTISRCRNYHGVGSSNRPVSAHPGKRWAPTETREDGTFTS